MLDLRAVLITDSLEADFSDSTSASQEEFKLRNEDDVKPWG